MIRLLASLGFQIALQQLLGNLQTLFDFLLLSLAVTVVQSLSQQRFGVFCLLHRLLHIFKQLLNLLALLVQLLLGSGLFVACAQTGTRLRLRFTHLFNNLLLALFDLSRLLLHLQHGFRELICGLLTHVVLHLIQLLLGARPRRQRLAGVALIQCLRRLLQILAGLFHLLLNRLHRFRIRLAVHLFLELIAIL